MRFHGGVAHPHAITLGHPFMEIAFFLYAHVVLLEAGKANHKAIVLMQMRRKDGPD